MDPMELSLLAIGAHPDDVELSCAGTLAKMVKLGYNVGILDLTEGELGTRGSREIRKKEARTAARILGVHVRENLRLPDGNFEMNTANRLKIIRLLRFYRPKLILIPHFQERHPDHVRAHHLCREAWYYSGLRKIETTFRGKKQEPWRPHRYFHFMQWYEFTPSFIVDISDVYHIRMESVKAYRSQFHDPASKAPPTILSQRSFLDFLETRARDFGYRIGAEYGEPFFSYEAIGIDDPFKLTVFKG
jgi:bacillithiol biosynthesis deacetylase BshB1